MLRCVARISCFFALFCAMIFTASFALAQTEFSADIVDLQKPGTPTTAKIYFAKDKMRIEPAASGPRSGGAVIVNFATQTSMVLMAQQHMYMEMPAQSQSQRMCYASAFFQRRRCGERLRRLAEDGTCYRAEAAIRSATKPSMDAAR